EAIWQIETGQQKILSDVDASSAALLDLQGQVGKRSFMLMASSKKTENANKGLFVGRDCRRKMLLCLLQIGRVFG
ncbi:hypothetical protein ACC672_37380, partial [Rhizobium ruizarguesonis]